MSLRDHTLSEVLRRLQDDRTMPVPAYAKVAARFREIDDILRVVDEVQNEPEPEASHKNRK